MITFNTSQLSKGIHFPNMKGVVETKQISFLKRLWRFFSFSRKFEIVENYFLWVDILQKFIFLTKTFIYNGASVPKLLGMFYSTTGVLFLGSGPHDFSYRYNGLFLIDPNTGKLEFQEMSKKEQDSLFNHLCQLETGMGLATGIARHSLMIFGIPAWINCRKRNCLVIRDFPEFYEDTYV